MGVKHSGEKVFRGWFHVKPPQRVGRRVGRSGGDCTGCLTVDHRPCG